MSDPKTTLDSIDPRHFPSALFARLEKAVRSPDWNEGDIGAFLRTWWDALGLSPQRDPYPQEIANARYEAAMGDPAYKGEASGAAASDADPDPKASDAKGMDAADHGGAATASAAGADEAREPAGEAASDRKAAATAEQKPEETVPPPVADKSKPAATEGSKPKAASGRQPRKASAKAGTKRD